jgi:DNA-binding NarL/FixJ family response regulator
LQDNGKIRVLLADDDEGYASSLGHLIDEQPELILVGIAHDGLQTVRLAHELDPDAVVIDLHMPRLDGVSAIGRLRDGHPHLCLIAVTGDRETALHQAAADAGADAVLVKGEIIAALVERIRHGR